MQNVKIRISRVSHRSKDIPLPAYATAGSSGMDIHAAVERTLMLRPGESALIPSGFRLEIPRGFEAQVRPRSGLALTYGVGILNAPGTIDSDYRGELKVILTNFSAKKFPVRRGDRIAQLVIAPVARAVWKEVLAVEKTRRGPGGFGHTGR